MISFFLFLLGSSYESQVAAIRCNTTGSAGHIRFVVSTTPSSTAPLAPPTLEIPEGFVLGGPSVQKACLTVRGDGHLKNIGEDWIRLEKDVKTNDCFYVLTTRGVELMSEELQRLVDNPKKKQKLQILGLILSALSTGSSAYLSAQKQNLETTLAIGILAIFFSIFSSSEDYFTSETLGQDLIKTKARVSAHFNMCEKLCAAHDTAHSASSDDLPDGIKTLANTKDWILASQASPHEELFRYGVAKEVFSFRTIGRSTTVEIPSGKAVQTFEHQDKEIQWYGTLKSILGKISMGLKITGPCITATWVSLRTATLLSDSSTHPPVGNATIVDTTAVPTNHSTSLDTVFFIFNILNPAFALLTIILKVWNWFVQHKFCESQHDNDRLTDLCKKVSEQYATETNLASARLVSARSTARETTHPFD